MEQTKEAIIEGIIFIAGDDGVTLDKLAEALQETEDITKEILKAMEKEYEENPKRGIELVSYGGKYKFVSKANVNPYAQKLFENIDVINYSSATLETLAIIAYKQPITRSQIEEIRGVSCDMIIRKLIARELIKEVGRTDSPGRPFLYEVTPSFLDSFKLGSLKDLPKLPDFEKPAAEKDLFE